MSVPLEIGLLTPACRGFNAVDGGIASHFADLASALVAQGHAVRVVTEAPAGPLPPHPELHGVRFATFRPQLPHWLDRLAGLRWQLHTVVARRHRLRAAAAVIRAEDAHRSFDVIETTGTGCLGLALATGARPAPLVTRVSTTAAQLVAHNRGPLRWPDRDELRLERLLVRASPGVITHTASHRAEICRQWGLTESAVAVIPHGILLPDFARLPPPRHGAATRALFVGRLEHRKGIDVLLAALPAVLDRVPGLTLTLAGQDPGEHWQRTFLRGAGTVLGERVTFAGCASAELLASLYRDCDFLVAPSRYESFGLTYVEAMAWGKPVIGCAVGGVPEVVADGETGLLVSPGDVAATAEAMVTLATDGARRAQLGRQARARAERHFSRATMAERSVAHYRKFISGRPA